MNIEEQIDKIFSLLFQYQITEDRDWTEIPEFNELCDILFKDLSENKRNILFESLKNMSYFNFHSDFRLDSLISLNSKGISFLQKYGSYLKYIENEKLYEQRELEAHEANIKSSKATVSASDSAKTSKNWAVITGIVGILSFCWAIYQTTLTNSLTDDVVLHEKQLAKQDSLIEKQHQQLTKFELLLNQKLSKK